MSAAELIEDDLGNVVDIEIGRTPSRAVPQFWRAGTTKWATISDFQHGSTITHTKESVSEEAVRQCNIRVHEPGTLVMSFKLTIGKLAFLGEPMATNEAIAALNPKRGVPLDRRYLFHYLGQLNFDAFLDRAAKGSTLNKAKLKRLPIRIPAEIGEQRRIAAILDKAEAIRRKREQCLALTDDLLRSVFLEIFGDPVDNPRGFPRERISDYLHKTRAGTQSGPFGSALKKHEYTDSGVPVWGVENVYPNRFNGEARLFISDEKYEDLKRYSVVKGDILISRAGTVGRMCVADTECERSIISTNLVRVSLDQSRLLPDYFVCLFTFFADRLDALKANNKDDAFTFLNPKTLREIKIPIPDMATQQNFVRASRSLKDVMARMQTQQQGLSDLFSSLSQRAFGGKL